MPSLGFPVELGYFCTVAMSHNPDLSDWGGPPKTRFRSDVDSQIPLERFLASLAMIYLVLSSNWADFVTKTWQPCLSLANYQLGNGSYFWIQIIQSMS